MSSTEDGYFGTADVIVFAGTLVLSAAIGIFFAWKDRKKETLENYYFGGKTMPPLPLGLSIAVTFISALTVIGLPTEAYFYGFVTMWYAFTVVIPTAVASLYYIPLVYRLNVSTIYEFLEMRFHPVARKLTSGIEVINTLVYMGFSVYLPALALNAVTPIKLQWSIILTSGVCTMYTAFGGLKAVVWTDAFQAVIMLIGTVAILIQSIISVGGMENVMEAAERGQRLNFFVFDFDPRIRSTFWTYLVGVSIYFCTASCVNQSVCQRYLSCKSVGVARKAAWHAVLPKVVLSAICIFSGIVAYAYFEGCDPLKSGEISKPDQMLPYLALKIFENLPGMAGFFIAATFSGTLSTVSSGINSLSVMILHDFVMTCHPKTGRVKQMIISKVTVFVLGAIVTGIAYMSSALPGTVISIVFSIRGSFSGPILGIFTLGVFFPWCNTTGALTGQLFGTVLTSWLAVGGIIYGKSPETQRRLPVSVDECPLQSSSELYTTTGFYSAFTSFTNGNVSSGYLPDTLTTEIPTEKVYNQLYSVSFSYYASIGFVSTFIIGMAVSMCTGPNKPKHMDPQLFMPILDNKIFPTKLKKFFRFGVPELEVKKADSKDLFVECGETQSEKNKLYHDSPSSDHDGNEKSLMVGRKYKPMDETLL